jgi:predicted membrane-bound spermidine synthase
MTSRPKRTKGPPKPEILEGAPSKNLLLHRIILVIMAFTAGAAVMIIELSAIRVLAPWFGNSLYTWTGLIGVILTAMSAGYYAGGWLADKKTSYTVLSHILAVAALFIFAIPLLSNLLGTPLAKYNVIMGPVFASILMFALPGCFLGSVSPYIIRLVSLLSADKHIGLSAGTVYMVSTIGSVLGTFAAGFWLIPSLDLESVFWFTGIAIALLACLGYFLSFRQRAVFAVHILVLCAALPVLVWASTLTKPPAEANLVFRKMSYYHLIRVYKRKLPSGTRITDLYLDTTWEGAQFDNSPAIPFKYLRYWQLAPLFSGKPETALFLGGGAFKVPQALLDHYPQARVEVVEIDPAVVAVGRRFFRVNNYPTMRVVVADARRYLTHTNRKYDLIFGDVYNGWRSIPSHLLTREFFQSVKNHLTKRGIFMMSLINTIQGNDAALFASVIKTISRVFPETLVFADYPHKLTKIQSIIIVAADFDLQPDSVLASLPPEEKSLKKLLLTRVSPQTYNTRDGYLLTDRFNPVEYLVAQTLTE